MNPNRIEISVDNQELRLLSDSEPVRIYPISTAEKGVGFQENSHRTPVGNFRIAEKIGAGAPPHTRFTGRQPAGEWDGSPDHGDLILSRILWLDGLDAANANSKDRFIYIHGTNHAELIGTPASCGCIRMSPADLIDLFDRVTLESPVRIIPPKRHRGKLIFFDCDSTLSSIEGIDELGRACGPEVFAEVEALTNAAMNGEVPINEVFARRMEIIQPSRKLCDNIGELYVETVTPGTPELINLLKADGWTPIILSGGFAPLIEPLARHLGIRHVEAVPLFFHEDGSYAGFGHDYPTTRNGGKPDIIAEWKAALRPETVIMVGDGISDLEARRETDLFVGFGGVVPRPAVKAKADIWIESMSEFTSVVPSDLGPQPEDS